LYSQHAQDIEAVTSVLTQQEQDQLRTLLKKIGLSAKAATAAMHINKPASF
jgi:MarR family 2-MHQ and catechol resistance regulon transcriptional repressor